MPNSKLSLLNANAYDRWLLEAQITPEEEERIEAAENKKIINKMWDFLSH
ncbi:hypothetical protein [Leeuwenhoekiella sp. MAR_2009_132]|nr:hypothetical protein [Leeuwenhoekiella sp. MAR_2009_132]